MTALTHVWLVARRELVERSRSPAFRVSLAVMLLTVIAMIVLPAVLTRTSTTADVGLTGRTPATLAATIQTHARAVGTTAHVRTFADTTSGEAAVRSGTVDVLVVDGRRLEWPKRVDEKLRAVLTGAVQVVAVQERAGAVGVSQAQLGALMAPVQVSNVELSKVAGRTAGDETAATIVVAMLVLTISVYGGLVLGGVVEEKTTRVVEVLLARIPARRLLAGKVLGIGMLGLAQVALTAAAAAIAVRTVHTFDVPSIRGVVLAWCVAWFVLGYAFYATLYGALGSLASRPEDAQSVAGPAMMVMVVSYVASFTMVAQPESVAARAISYVPTSAPMAMPGRIAMGATSWWEPVVAALLDVAVTVWLIRVGGRLYASAVLHGGPTLKLRDAWRASKHSRPGDTGEPPRGPGSAGPPEVSAGGTTRAPAGARG